MKKKNNPIDKEIINAVHDDQLVELLDNLNLKEKIKAKAVNCFFCGEISSMKPCFD